VGSCGKNVWSSREGRSGLSLGKIAKKERVASFLNRGLSWLSNPRVHLTPSILVMPGIKWGFRHPGCTLLGMLLSRVHQAKDSSHTGAGYITFVHAWPGMLGPHKEGGWELSHCLSGDY
jgi:hypothetical protein